MQAEAAEAPPPSLAAPSNPSQSLQSIAESLDRDSTAEIQAVYEDVAGKLAALEGQLCALRPAFRVVAMKFAARLKAEDRHGCGLYGGVFYRAHADGTGVRREKEADPRWLKGRKGSEP